MLPILEQGEGSYCVFSVLYILITPQQTLSSKYNKIMPNGEVMFSIRCQGWRHVLHWSGMHMFSVSGNEMELLFWKSEKLFQLFSFSWSSLLHQCGGVLRDICWCSYRTTYELIPLGIWVSVNQTLSPKTACHSPRILSLVTSSAIVLPAASLICLPHYLQSHKHW